MGRRQRLQRVHLSQEGEEDEAEELLAEAEQQVLTGEVVEPEPEPEQQFGQGVAAVEQQVVAEAPVAVAHAAFINHH